MSDYKANFSALLTQWWPSPLGECVQQCEQQLLNDAAQYFFGYHQLQIGGVSNMLPVTNRSSCQAVMQAEGNVVGNAESLPFRSYSIDNLLLLHVLEFSKEPHQILREAERVLVDDGSLIICSFNPLSLWGLKRLFSWQDKVPWRGHFFTNTRIKDWLTLLNFEVVAVEHVMFRPPFKRASWLRRTRFLERWGRRLWPFFGSITFLVASKRTIPVTPIGVRWSRKQLFPAGRLVRPITRDKING